MTTTDARSVTAEAMAERLLDAALATADIFAVYLGDRLGWYTALAVAGSLTPDQLARETSTHPRYAREWLEQQAATGIVIADSHGCFALPPGAAEVLTDRNSLNYLAPIARMFAAAGAHLPDLVNAYRAGGGVAWSELGADARESQADMNRPWYEKALPRALAGVPAVHEILDRPGVRILDVGCGAGWSSIALARAYPAARVTGRDIDAPTVELARGNVETAGIADRVTLELGDASVLPPEAYNIAFAFECVHDMPRPVEVLRAVRAALRPGGLLVVMDEAVAEDFTAPADVTDRLMYGFSLLVCLPDGMSQQPSAGTGTVMRPRVLRSYAEQAGFRRTDVLPIEDFGFWRFYALHP
ncbi:MAG: methyltransferase domain-containing protein [Actinomycetota bacterium]|nr:methyltransferase domain-containing protein [Actinomycetota bacterium]